MPDRFIARNEGSTAMPTGVGSEDFEIVEELATMEGQRFEAASLVIDFDSTGLER